MGILHIPIEFAVIREQKDNGRGKWKTVRFAAAKKLVPGKVQAKVTKS